MRRDIEKSRQARALRQERRKRPSETWLEFGMKDGVPALYCNGEVVMNAYTLNVAHDEDGRYRSSVRMSVDAEFVYRSMRN